MAWICKVLLKIFGWKIVGDVKPKGVKKYLVVAAPHTSTWDLIIAIFSRTIAHADIGFLGKHTIFKPPFGGLVRWMGGHPVDRSKSNNLVDQVIEMFDEKETFALALSPEGTRKKVEKLKSGFYHIARGANIPIILTKLDFANKTLDFSEPYWLSENKEKEMEYIWNYFKGVKGKYSEKSIF